MLVQRSHEIKLKPNKTQLTGLAKAAGTARYVYNWGLVTWEQLYKEGKDRSYGILDAMWTQAKPAWANEVNRQCQDRALRNLETAYKRYFQGLSNKPKLRKRGVNDSFYVDCAHAHLVQSKKIMLPKIGTVRMAEALRYKDAKIVSYTVKRKADGWYVIIQVNVNLEQKTDSTSAVGVDVGCTKLAIASDGTTCLSPGKLKDLRKQEARRQKLLARKQRQSKNYEKARNKLDRTYQRITNIQQDVSHKFTAKIAKNHGVVCIEDLDVVGLQQSKNKSVRKGVHNACMYEILRQLGYKANNLIKVNRYYPSSKTCSNCGHVNKALGLKVRTYHCPSCGHTIDRDLNAAINLRNEGLRIYTVGHTGSACGETRFQLELGL